MDVGFRFSGAEFQGKGIVGFRQQRRQAFPSNLPAALESTPPRRLGLGPSHLEPQRRASPARWAPLCSRRKPPIVLQGLSGAVSLVQASAPSVGGNLGSGLSLAFTSRRPREGTLERIAVRVQALLLFLKNHVTSQVTYPPKAVFLPAIRH